MSIDSAQKRMSAMTPRCVWRGSRVDATETDFNAGNRRAANFSYSLVTVTVSSVLAKNRGLLINVGKFMT